METRLIIAYLLIALLLAAAVVAAWSIAHRRREQRKLMRGHKLDVLASDPHAPPH